MKENIIVIGGGGHAKVVIDAIRNEDVFTVKGIVDAAFPKDSKVFGVDILGGDDALKELYSAGVRYAVIGIGTLGQYELKRNVYKKLKACGFILPVVRHPSSVIAADVTIGAGSFIAAGVVINAGVVIGDNVIVNTRVSIDHDCRVGDYTHISPGAIVCGGVAIGSAVHIGAGAVVVQNIRIADNIFVKAASLVIKDMGEPHV